MDEEGRRSDDKYSGYVVKNRSSSGCLVVRKKGVSDDAGSSRHGSKVFEERRKKKEKKRARVDPSDSGSSDDDELPMPQRRKVAPQTLQVCNGMSGFDSKDGEDVGGGDGEGRKRNRLDVFEFDEYDGGFDSGPAMLERSGIGKKKSYCERSSGRDGFRHPISFLREKYNSGEPIRVQGKNGVLKVMVNKKKNALSSSSSYDHHLEVDGSSSRKAFRTEDRMKRTTPDHPLPHSDSKRVEKANSYSKKEKKSNELPKALSKKKREIEQDSDSDALLKLGLRDHKVRKSVKTPLPMKKSKEHDTDSDDGDTSLKLGPRDAGTHKSMKGATIGSQQVPQSHLQPNKSTEGKVRRGSGTEKQKLREQIRGMLLNSGWTIDYRPRRNRDYLDAVYINPSGTAYWSIIKAYEALQKQLNDDEDEAKSRGDGSPFTPLSDELLSQLTRRTKKKMEREMERKQRDGNESENPGGTFVRKSSSIPDDEDSVDSGSHEEKLSSFLKHGGKSLKGKLNDNKCVSMSSKGRSSTHHFHGNTEKQSSGSNTRCGSESSKLGRCTLLARNPTDGQNMEIDGFVPYAGKRTLLSWLIDSGTVQLSQKVRYMNRRRTKVMLEGWVTRDGIHCGCCSKILTVSKFEIHAGSKLRQAFQNIYLESGVSLLECQIAAWNGQELTERSGFNTVDTNCDDPNDDTCGICGDGGDLICCDGCPSTFHQSCLGIKILPPGDWHCPNCSCKLCGAASLNVDEGDDRAVSLLNTCSLCAKKYHTSCLQETDLSGDACFCGKKCEEIFQQLQRHLGVKHELDAGYSWSLIRRADIHPDTTPQELSQRIECNSKLAVALSVMDECFLPIVDRRSGFNLIHSVLYNCGSNFNRLNYSGFYTFILERGDEIISAASVRFHGSQLAEMPFISTRHMYRRQGMCRRLLGAIESMLCSMKLEKLIIPAISELMHTWTEVFGFTTLDESLKQEIKSLNMLVFPGIDMLQKQLLKQENGNGNKTKSAGAMLAESKDSEYMKREVANESDTDSLSGIGSHKNNCSGLEPASEANDEVTAANSDSVETSEEHKSPVLLKEKICTNSESENKLDDPELDKEIPCKSDANNNANKMDDKSGSLSPASNMQSIYQGDRAAESHSQGVSSDFASVASSSLDDSDEHEDLVSLGTAADGSQSENKLTESDCGRNGLIAPDVSGEREESKLHLGSSALSSEGADIDDAHEKQQDASVSEDVKVPIDEKEFKCAGYQSGDDFSPVASKGKHLCNSSKNQYLVGKEIEPLLDCSIQADTMPCKDSASPPMEEMKTGDPAKKNNELPGIPAEDNTQTCKEGETGQVDVDMACAEAAPSSQKNSAENSGNNIKEVSDVPVNGVNKNDMEIETELGNADGSSGLNNTMETSNGTTCEGIPPHASEGRAGAASSE